MADVDLVLVSWNSAEWLPRCLESIAGLRGDLEVIFVDNASEDDSVALCESSGLGRVVKNDRNLGFAAAVNQGIAAGSAPWIQLLNPDATIAPDYCEILTEAGSGHEDVGSLTGLLVRGEGSGIVPTNIIDSRGIQMTRSARHFDLDADTLIRPFPAVEEVFGVSGAAGCFRRSFLAENAVEGEMFDEDFFAYREDADLAWRGRIAGWRSLSVSAARGVHVRRVTPSRRRVLPDSINCHSVKNRFLLRWKNAGHALTLIHFPHTLARDLVVIAALLTVETSSLPALGWLWKNRRRISHKRRIIQQRRTVSDLELAHWFR